MKKGRILAVLITFAMVAAMLPGTAFAQSPNVVWVNAEWDGLGAGASIEDPFGNPLDYLTNGFYRIGEAMEEVAEGGIIYVMPGEYDNEFNDVPGQECILHFNKSLTLQGVDSNGNYIEAADHPDMPKVYGWEYMPNLDGDPSYIVSADNVNIFGMHFFPAEDTYVNSVFNVTGNNFFLKDCTIDTYYGNDLSLDIEGAAAEKAIIGLNILNGGIYIHDGAGSDGININSSEIIHSGQMGAIYLRNAYEPEVINNDIMLDPNIVDHDYQLVAFSNDDPNEYSTWILDTLGKNRFESACAVITDMETNDMPVLEELYIVAYASFEKAAVDADTGDTIIIFHPRAEHGVTFDSSLVPDEGNVAIFHHVIAFLPKASLPGNNDYTVTLYLNPPSVAPADAPEGYEIIGVMTATIQAGGTPFSEFEGPVTFWVILPDEVEDPEKAAFFWYDEEAEEWVLLEGTLDDGCLIVELDHWSDFALMEGEGEEPILPVTGKNIPWLAPLGLLLLLAGAVLIRRKAVA